MILEFKQWLEAISPQDPTGLVFKQNKYSNEKMSNNAISKLLKIADHANHGEYNMAFAILKELTQSLTFPAQARSILDMFNREFTAKMHLIMSTQQKQAFSKWVTDAIRIIVQTINPDWKV